MKKILPLALTLCGAACLVTVAVRAASTPAPAAPAANPQPGEQFAGMMAERLGLTAEQKAKLDGLRQAQRTALDAVAADKTLSPEDRRAKVRGLMESGREQMKTVLTPEQRQKVAMVRERFMGGRGPGGPQQFGRGRGHDFDRSGPGPRRFGHHRPDSRAMHFMVQRAHKMAKHQRERRAEAIGLTDEQRAKMRQIAFQHREKEIALRKELRTEMEGVLTPEQKAKAKEMKEHHGRRGPDYRRGDKAMPPPAGP